MKIITSAPLERTFVASLSTVDTSCQPAPS